MKKTIKENVMYDLWSFSKYCNLKSLKLEKKVCGTKLYEQAIADGEQRTSLIQTLPDEILGHVDIHASMNNGPEMSALMFLIERFSNLGLKDKEMYLTPSLKKSLKEAISRWISCNPDALAYFTCSFNKPMNEIATEKKIRLFDKWLYYKTLAQTAFTDPLTSETKNSIIVSDVSKETDDFAHFFYDNEDVVENYSPNISLPCKSVLDTCTNVPWIGNKEFCYQIKVHDDVIKDYTKSEITPYFSMAVNRMTELKLKRLIFGKWHCDTRHIPEPGLVMPCNQGNGYKAFVVASDGKCPRLFCFDYDTLMKVLININSSFIVGLKDLKVKLYSTESFIIRPDAILCLTLYSKVLAYIRAEQLYQTPLKA